MKKQFQDIIDIYIYNVYIYFIYYIFKVVLYYSFK